MTFAVHYLDQPRRQRIIGHCKHRDHSRIRFRLNRFTRKAPTMRFLGEKGRGPYKLCTGLGSLNNLFPQIASAPPNCEVSGEK